MNLIFQVLILILITFIIFWIIAGAEVFSEINKNKSLCNNLTMKDCLNNPNCKYITSSKDFRVNSCVNIVVYSFATFKSIVFPLSE